MKTKKNMNTVSHYYCVFGTRYNKQREYLHYIKIKSPIYCLQDSKALKF